MVSLPLTPAVDVIYDLPPISAPRRGFNLGLIVGPSDVIDPSDRVEVFQNFDEVVAAGFENNSPEYEAAALYFASPSQPRQLAIGRQASGETPLEAIQACRVADTEWYIAYSTEATNEDHLEIAEYIEALSHYSMYFINTGEAGIISNLEGNLFATLKGLNYRRTMGMYSSTDHAVASILGYAMGQTRDANNSAYTLKFKRMPGVTAEPLTTQQVNNVLSNRGNVYINRGHFYDWFEDSKTFNGGWFDETIFLDKLANEIQLNVADLLYQHPKIPQTEPGMARIKTVVAQACDRMVNIGFIAPGQWNGGPILTLKTGDYLPNGYLVLSEAIDDQPQADRDARKAPPIYVAIKLAGAIQSVFIRVNVNR
jgi:hypothetical protein